MTFSLSILGTEILSFTIGRLRPSEGQEEAPEYIDNTGGSFEIADQDEDEDGLVYGFAR